SRYTFVCGALSKAASSARRWSQDVGAARALLRRAGQGSQSGRPLWSATTDRAEEDHRWTYSRPSCPRRATAVKTRAAWAPCDAPPVIAAASLRDAAALPRPARLRVHGRAQELDGTRDQGRRPLAVDHT